MDRAADSLEPPQDRLALIECFERDGRPGRTVDVHAWPLTLGRALHNDVVLDDPFVAPHHARIDRGDDGMLGLTVLDTHNGITVDGKHHAAGEHCVLPVGGAALQLGQSRLRLRLPGELLAPEQPLPRPAASTLWLALPLVALQLGEHAIKLDPGADATSWLPPLLSLPLMVIAWCAVWALMSKVFQHRFDFGGHLRIALPWLLAFELLSVLVPQAGAALGWPGLWRALAPLQILLGALWMWAHLAQVLPQHRRIVAAVVAAFTLTGGVILLAFTHRATDSFSRAPYMSTLPLPSLRLAGTVAPAVLIADMAALESPLARRVKKSGEDERDSEADAESGGDDE